MRIVLVTPQSSTSQTGNAITARRWAAILRDLGHRVRVEPAYEAQPCDVLVALHARRSAPSVRRFHSRHPGKPLIVALTGTDLYQDLPNSASAQESLELASRLVLLQVHFLYLQQIFQ